MQAAYDLNITIPNDPKILVAYFSSSGNTENAAQIIQQKTGGDLFEIEMATPYTGALYQQSQQDLYAGTRPALRTHVENMDQYDVILLGYPTWLAYHNLIQCTQA